MQDDRVNPNRDQSTWNGHIHEREPGGIVKDGRWLWSTLKHIEQAFADLECKRDALKNQLEEIQGQNKNLMKDIELFSTMNNEAKKEIESMLQSSFKNKATILRVELERNEALSRITAYEQMTFWGRVKFLFKWKS